MSMVTRTDIDIDVKALREEAGVSQEQLAQLLGTSWATVSRWERHLSKPEPAALGRLERLREAVKHVGRAVRRDDLPRFFLTAHPMLHGYRPVDLLESRYSFRDLIAFIEAAKSGDMA